MSASRLKFLVDVGVGKKVEEYLHDENYDIKTVRSLDQRMPDQDIIRLAALEKRIVITMDKDFGELVYHSGILLLRLEDATGSEKQQSLSCMEKRRVLKVDFTRRQEEKMAFRQDSRQPDQTQGHSTLMIKYKEAEGHE
jgi:predicted nuclease of predicted toxin-antitoxin system